MKLGKYIHGIRKFSISVPLTNSQFQPNLAKGILGWRGSTLHKKDHTILKKEIMSYFSSWSTILLCENVPVLRWAMSPISPLVLLFDSLNLIKYLSVLELETLVLGLECLTFNRRCPIHLDWTYWFSSFFVLVQIMKKPEIDIFLLILFPSRPRTCY